jgi:hypothetical protein
MPHTRSTARPATLGGTGLLLLLLTACGGGGTPHAKITGAATKAASASPSPSASATTTDGKTTKLPSTAVPSDLKLVFDWPRTGNATKDAVLSDGEQYIRAMSRAEAHDDLKDPAYQFYSRDQALTYAYGQINNNVKGGWAPTGIDRYYRATIDVVNSRKATLTFCRNQTKSYSKKVATGKINYTPDNDPDNYLLYSLLLVKDSYSHGIWQTTRIQVLRRPQCKS